MSGPNEVAIHHLPPKRGGLATLVVMGVVAAVIVGAVVGFGPQGVVSPSGSPAATDTPAPSAETWAAVGALPPLQPLATLTPAHADAAGIAADTAFTLASLGTVSAGDLAAGLTVEPAVALRVTPGTDAASALVTPAGPLDAGGLYHFRLTSPAGALAGQWAFQVKAPLHVVTALPGDQSTEVPIDSGIELTFDQDGALDPASHFAIEPAVTGRFETHGRTLVFVPSKLEPATIYTVTLSAGIGVSGSDVHLEQDVRVRFETLIGQTVGEEPFAVLARRFTEAAPDQRAFISLHVEQPQQGDAEVPPPQVTQLPVEVYRLPGAAAAQAATQLILDAPDWARTTVGLVPTAGLARVAAFEATLQYVDDGTQIIQLPATLPIGVYLVVIPRKSRDLQGILQVTRLASYTLVSSTRSLVWTNRIGGGAWAGVKVAIAGGSVLGTTDASGLLLVDTPAAPSVGGSTPVLLTLTTPDGERVLAPVGVCCSDDAPARSWWKAISTDRILYRQNDTIDVWGYLRDRDTGLVPQRAEVRLILDDQGADAPPIASTVVIPRASGAFVASLPLVDAPINGYIVQVVVDGGEVSSAWLNVDVLRKPAYRLAVAVDRHVFLDGEAVHATVTARFYEGTVAPQVSLSVDAPGSNPLTVTSGADGVAVVDPVLRVGVDTGGSTSQPVTAGVTDAEEGSISAEAPVIVFPSASWLEGTSKLSGDRLVATGTVNQVDVPRLEREFDAQGQIDPKGAPIAAAAVTAEIIEEVPIRRSTGQRYDFIAKKVVNLYETTIDERSLGTQTLTTDASGRFSLSRTVPDPGNGYRIHLSVADSAGRKMTAVLYASASGPGDETYLPNLPYLGTAPEGACGSRDSIAYGVGDAMRLTMADRSGSYPTGHGNTYLFVTAQRGIRDVILQASPTFAGTFTAADVPNLGIVAVRFTGHAYLDGAYVDVRLRVSDRQLSVHLSTDAPRYRPGGSATVTVRTLDPAGRPVPATVTLRGVDEKIYALGGAQEEDPLGQLYGAWLYPGLGGSYASHPEVRSLSDYGGCGGAGGGGDDSRDDFRDTLFYRQMDTGPDGVGTVTFQLSDDLTSWHLSAAAVTADLKAGVGSLLIPVGLPFFVEPTLAPEYLLGDRPSVRLRAFGSDLHAGDAVSFTVASDSLGMPVTTVTGRAFEPVDVPLPALKPGDQALVISGSAGNGALADRLTRHFSVVASRLLRTETRYTTLAANTIPEGGAGLTTYLFSDAGRGHYLPVLDALAWGDGPRLDQALAAVEARKLLASVFGVDPATFPDSTFEASRYQHGDQGIALLPYASPSLELTVRAALAAPGAFDQTALRNAMANATEVEGGPTREGRIQTLVVRAALGDDVLLDVRAAAAATDLSVPERLYLAIAASTLGDGLLASDLERALLAEYGQRLGPWIRLRPGGSPNGTPANDSTIAATALWALVAIEVGDPYADEAEAYVEANPLADDLSALQQLAFAARAIERTPAAAASFAYSVDGARTVVALEPGASRTLTLTAAQRATLHLEPVSGEVGMATSWRVPLDPAAVKPDPDLTLTRTVTPAGPVASGRVVLVELNLAFGAGALKGCTDVVDLAPSGLAPLAALPNWLPPEVSPPDVLWPYLIAGQRVAFCAGFDPKRPSARMRYYARVVTSGTYLWEAASAQSTVAHESITLTGATTIELR
jgi:hypothetical protein